MYPFVLDLPRLREDIKEVERTVRRLKKARRTDAEHRSFFLAQKRLATLLYELRAQHRGKLHKRNGSAEYQKLVDYTRIAYSCEKVMGEPLRSLRRFRYLTWKKSKVSV